MNNKIRKELRLLLENELFFYNANVKKYNYYNDSSNFDVNLAEKYLGSRVVAEKLCEKYSHSCCCLVRMLNLADSRFDYSLKYKTLDFYSECYLFISEKVEG